MSCLFYLSRNFNYTAHVYVFQGINAVFPHTGRGAATPHSPVSHMRSGTYPCTHTIFTLTESSAENTFRRRRSSSSAMLFFKQNCLLNLITVDFVHRTAPPFKRVAGTGFLCRKVYIEKGNAKSPAFLPSLIAKSIKLFFYFMENFHREYKDKIGRAHV